MNPSRTLTGEASHAMGRHKFIVPDISCQHCSETIEGALAIVEGVKAVDVDLGTKQVIIEGEAAPEEVAAAIGRAGYEAEAVFADRPERTS